MNKTDFIAAIAEKTSTTKAEAATYLEAVLDTLTEIFQHKDTLKLPSFGTFGVKTRAARSGRHPGTGKEMKIPAAQVPFVRLSTRIKALTKSDI